MNMTMMQRCGSLLAAFGIVLAAGPAHAALPAPTPEQQQAAAQKKAQADAQAAKEKELLGASMEKVAGYWRERASSSGWQTHPPVAAAAAQAGQSGTPQSSKPPEATPQPPIRSEKAGTAPPSRDVKPENPISVRETGPNTK